MNAIQFEGQTQIGHQNIHLAADHILVVENDSQAGEFRFQTGFDMAFQLAFGGAMLSIGVVPACRTGGGAKFAWPMWAINAFKKEFALQALFFCDHRVFW